MKVFLCTDRKTIYEQMSRFLKEEIEFFESHPINRELIDQIYKSNPDIIFFDLFTKKILKWKIAENLTTVPSLREIPLILLLNKKTKNLIQRICRIEAFDYVFGEIMECEILMKIKKAEEIVKLKREYSRILTKDPLTGAYNRSYLMNVIQQELSWCSIYKDPLSLAIFDIDHFKKINDTYGHLSGDRILSELVSLAITVLPKKVTLGRYGGEEFFIVMPSTDENQGFEICENLRKSIADSSFKTFYNETLNISISIGITTYYGEEPITPSELIQKADIALYRAKKSGRNKVIFETFVVE